MANAVEIELKLMQDEFDRALKGAKERLGDLGDESAEAGERASKAYEKFKKHVRSAVDDHVKLNKEQEKFKRVQDQIHRSVERAEKARRYGSGMFGAASAVGAGAMAAGMPLAGAVGMGSVAQLLTSGGHRVAAGFAVRKHQRELAAAEKKQDVEAMKEAGDKLVDAKQSASYATRGMAVAGGAVVAGGIIKGIISGFGTERVKRQLFQATGAGGSEMFAPAGREQALENLMTPGERAQLAIGLARTGAITGGQGREARGTVDLVGRYQRQFGEHVTPEISGMLGMAVGRGGVTGDSASKERQIAELIGEATGIATASNLERGRIGEAFEAMTAVGNSLAPGVRFNRGAIADIVGGVSQQGPQFAGRGGISTAQAALQFQTGQGGRISKMLNMARVMSTAAARGEQLDPLELMMRGETPDPEGMREFLGKHFGSRSGRRALAFGVGQETGRFTQSAAVINAALGVVPGGGKVQHGDPIEAARGVIAQTLPEDLKTLAMASTNFNTAVEEFGDTIAITLGPALLKLAEQALGVTEDFRALRLLLGSGAAPGSAAANKQLATVVAPVMQKALEENSLTLKLLDFLGLGGAFAGAKSAPKVTVENKAEHQVMVTVENLELIAAPASAGAGVGSANVGSSRRR